jgi:hypothetical protein
VAEIAVGGTTHEVTVTVGPDGALTGLGMRRWGPLDRRTFGEQPFGAVLDGELTAGGVRVPRQVIAGYGYGTDREVAGRFIRWTVDDLRLC